MLKHILQILTFAAILQSIILLIYLFTKSGNSKYEKLILISLFLTFCIFVSGDVIVIFYGPKHYYKVFHILNLVVFLAAPLLYFYFLGKLNDITVFKSGDLKHLIPFALILIFVVPLVITSTRKTLPFNNYGPLITAALFLQNLFYFLLVLRKIKEKKAIVNVNSRKLYDTEATIQSINFEITWLQRIFLMFFIIILVKTAGFLACRLFSLIEYCVLFTGSYFVLTFILINSIILFGLSKSTLFEEKGRYQSKGIKDVIKSDYIKKLENALYNEKLYLDPLISMEKLSKNLKIPRNDLSRIINENFALNFNEMINQFRINDAKNLICKSGGSTSIINIAYMVGYNSKSTFNTAFKRYTGKTPSSYLLN